MKSWILFPAALAALAGVAVLFLRNSKDSGRKKKSKPAGLCTTDPADEEQIDLEPGSLAVSAAQVDGVSPSLRLGPKIENDSGIGEFEPSALLLRRQGSQVKDGDTLTIGPPLLSMAVSAAELDDTAPSPTLVLNHSLAANNTGNGNGSLVFRRQSSKKLICDQQQQTCLTMAVTAAEFEGVSPKITISDASNLFAKRKSARNLILPSQGVEPSQLSLQTPSSAQLGPQTTGLHFQVGWTRCELSFCESVVAKERALLGKQGKATSEALLAAEAKLSAARARVEESGAKLRQAVWMLNA